ncbi:MAG: PqiC family protein [Candidatus Methylumidiphilus sp.]
MKLPRPIPLLTLPILLLALSACIGGKSPPSQFYLLEPLKGGGSVGVGIEAGQVIALAPVRIPQYVDRPQMVTATGKNAYALSETNRWAERLDDNIARVLAQNLGLLVPAEVVLSNASNRAKQARFKLSVTILEFHVDREGQAGLVAQWNVARGEETVMGRQAVYREPASATDYAAMAGALNSCLNRLSRDVALDLRGLAGGN